MATSGTSLRSNSSTSTSSCLGSKFAEILMLMWQSDKGAYDRRMSLLKSAERR